MKPGGLILVLILAVTAIVLSPVLGNGFVIQDDPIWIYQNPQLNPPSLQSLAFFWTTPTHGLWVPLTCTVWTLLSAISGDPRLFHAASLLMHLLSTAIVWRILRRLLGRDAPAIIGTMIFAIHPLHVESVAWASGLKDVLAGLLALCVVDQYIRAVDATASGRRGLHYVVCILALLTGMLAKPSAVVAPALAGVIDLWLLRRRARDVLLWIAPLVLLTIPCILWSRMIQTPSPQLDPSPLLRPLIAADTIAFYLYKLVWPIDLVNLYGRRPDLAQAQGWLWWTWLLPAALLVLLIMRRRNAALIAGGLCFVVALLPVLGFTPFMYQLYSTVADHYMYLPMFGIALAAGGVVLRWESRPLYAVAGAVLFLLAVRTMLQVHLWRDSVTLFARAAAYDPTNAQSQVGLATALASAGRIEEALPHLETVIDAQPRNADAHQLMGQMYLDLRENLRALGHLQFAAELRPDDPQIAALLDEARRRLASPATTQ